MVALIPSEASFGGILMPPALLVCLLAFFVAMVVSRILNRTRLSRFFWNPPVALLAMWVLFCAIIGLFVIAP